MLIREKAYLIEISFIFQYFIEELIVYMYQLKNIIEYLFKFEGFKMTNKGHIIANYSDFRFYILIFKEII